MRFSIRYSPVWRPVLTVLGMPADRCFAEIDPDRGTLRVSGGAWFDETFPLAEITSVDPSSWPWYGGLGVKLGPTGQTVSVVASLDGIVAVRFRRPQKMRVIFSVNRPELRVSLEDPEGFMDALRRELDRVGHAA
jgi:hypothetical protein